MRCWGWRALSGRLPTVMVPATVSFLVLMIGMVPLMWLVT